ncbi:MAG TPA: class I SAM-dependent methyltransferase [Candidatus Limnocylindria bacterium]
MHERELHDLAVKGFGAAGARYESGRPDYPPAGVALLAARLGIGPGATVADVGAGTGKLTRALVATGATVIAVEPLASMRDQIPFTAPRAVPFDGTAEAMALRDGSMDAITVAQAFHWFDGPRALAEFHRVLRPRGHLGLLWNERDRATPWVAAFDRIIDAVDPDRPDHALGRWRTAFDTTRLFTPLEHATVPYARIHRLPDGLIGRIATVSSVAALPPADQERIFGEVRALVQTHPDLAGRSEVELPYRTHLYWCRRTDESAPRLSRDQQPG